MNEREWLTTTDAAAMMGFVLKKYPSWITDYVSADHIREGIGNPFRPVLGTCLNFKDGCRCPMCHPWRKLLTTNALTVAKACRDEPTAGHQAALHDALAEAGCDCEELLKHLAGLRRCRRCLGLGCDDGHYGPGGELAAACSCDGSGWLPLPTMACGRCRGEKGYWLPFASAASHWIRCQQCDGSGQVPLHTSECWAVRLILGGE